MKLNIVLLVIFLNLINLILSSPPQPQLFINFQVYNDEQCIIKQNYGIGYSIALDSCITIDHKFNYVFTHQNIQISWDKYKNDKENQCNGQPIAPTTTYFMGQCISSDKFIFNTLRSANLKPVYYKLILTNQPYYPSTDVIVSSYSVGDCQTSKIIEYYINGTEFIMINHENYQKEPKHHEHKTSYSYSCINGKPYIQKCKNGQCKKPHSTSIKCHSAEPFYTYIPPPTSESSNSESSNSCISAGYSGFTGCLPEIKENDYKYNGGKGNTLTHTKYYNSMFC